MDKAILDAQEELGALRKSFLQEFLESILCASILVLPDKALVFRCCVQYKA